MIGWLRMISSLIMHDQRLFCTIEWFWCEPITIGQSWMILSLIETLFPTETVFLWFWSLYSSDWQTIYCVGELMMSWRYRKASIKVLERFYESFEAFSWETLVQRLSGEFLLYWFNLFFYSKACTSYGGRLKVDPRIYIIFFILFLLSSYRNTWYRILHNRCLLHLQSIYS